MTEQPIPSGNNPAPEGDMAPSGNRTFFNDDGALVRMDDEVGMPELFKPSTSTWVRFPDFDDIAAREIDEQRAAEMAGSADALNAPLDESAPPVMEGGGDGEEASQAQGKAQGEGPGGPAAEGEAGQGQGSAA